MYLQLFFFGSARVVSRINFLPQFPLFHAAASLFRLFWLLLQLFAIVVTRNANHVVGISAVAGKWHPPSNLFLVKVGHFLVVFETRLYLLHVLVISWNYYHSILVVAKREPHLDSWVIWEKKFSSNRSSEQSHCLDHFFFRKTIDNRGDCQQCSMCVQADVFYGGCLIVTTTAVSIKQASRVKNSMYYLFQGLGGLRIIME